MLKIVIHCHKTVESTYCKEKKLKFKSENKTQNKAEFMYQAAGSSYAISCPFPGGQPSPGGPR